MKNGSKQTIEATDDRKDQAHGEGTDIENPCIICSAHQQCCSQLSGLWLSEKEFQALFEEYAKTLDVFKYKGIYTAIAKDEKPCPYWTEKGCRIYQERPMDCRLYPYEITRIVKRRKSIGVRFRPNPGCPEKEDLLPSVEEAKSLIAAFCRDVYGPGKRLEIEYGEPPADGPLVSLIKPWIARISRVLRAYRR